MILNKKGDNLISKLTKNQIKILKYLYENKDNSAITEDNVYSLFKMDWDTYKLNVNTLLDELYLRKPCEIDYRISKDIVAISLLGITFLNERKYKFKNIAYKWIPVVCALISTMIAIWSILN